MRTNASERRKSSDDDDDDVSSGRMITDGPSGSWISSDFPEARNCWYSWTALASDQVAKMEVDVVVVDVVLVRGMIKFPFGFEQEIKTRRLFVVDDDCVTTGITNPLISCWLVQINSTTTMLHPNNDHILPANRFVILNECVSKTKMRDRISTDVRDRVLFGIWAYRLRFVPVCQSRRLFCRLMMLLLSRAHKVEPNFSL